MRSPLAFWTLASGTLMLALAGWTSAESTHTDPHALCQLFPADEFPNGLKWSPPEVHDHGGAPLLLSERAELGGPSTEDTFAFGAHSETPATSIGFNGHEAWRVVVSVSGSWNPATPEIPDVEDVVLETTTDFLLNGVVVGSDTEEVMIKKGALSNPTGVLGPDNAFERLLEFTDTPGNEHSPAATLDQVGTNFRIQLKDSSSLDAAGTLRIRFELFRLGADGGAMFEIPGACGSSDHGHGGSGGGHQHGHNAESNCGQTDLTCGGPDEVCSYESGYCDASSRSDAEEASPDAVEPAALSNASPSALGPAVVTATLGVAGLACFRPRAGP